MTLAYWRREAIEKEVVLLLREHGVSKYPINVSQLIDQMKIPVIAYEKASDDDRALFNLASSDAFSVNNLLFTNPKIIIKTKGLPETRKDFTLGHELGHIWLEHAEEDPLREAEADYFSGYLLAPHPLIVHYGLLKSGLASAFGIGSWCADIACSQAFERIKRGSNVALPHERWLLDNVKFERRDYGPNIEIDRP